MIPFLKFAVIFMGILIVAGLVVIGIKIMQKSDDVSKAMNSPAEEDMRSSYTEEKITDLIAKTDTFKVQLNDVQKGTGWQLSQILSQNDRLILHLRNAEGVDKVMIVSLEDGSLLGEIHVTNQVR